MMHATHTPPEDWHENAYDLVRGIAAYSGSAVVAGIGRVIARHRDADIANAFNYKQVGCKIWARDKLLESAGSTFDRIAVLGGWYGVLPAMLFEDTRFNIGAIDSYDIDPAVEEVARTLNSAHGDRFRAITADMYALDYRAIGADLIVNTSCEHIGDLKLWLELIPSGTRVLLQSNDYFSEPTHISCVSSLEEFQTQAGLATLDFAGALPMKKYNRFMLIGTV
ncbi:class I SAM-dependent methyltransferase [Sinorhizobium chiapasense]|uniref:Class I SAM-dependent methyltransferase n=1 Tax=Sinorhizobium chiapasense TaxID=501572 RepID=A0ABZ2BNU6_9HYPH